MRSIKQTFQILRDYKIGILLIGIGICGLAATIIIQELDKKVDMLAIGTGSTGFLVVLAQRGLQRWTAIQRKQQKLLLRAQTKVVSAAASSATTDAVETATQNVVGNAIHELKQGLKNIDDTVRTINNSVSKLALAQLDSTLEIAKIENTVRDNHAEGQKAITGLIQSIETDRRLNSQLHEEHKQMQQQLSNRITKVEETVADKLNHIESMVLKNSDFIEKIDK